MLRLVLNSARHRVLYDPVKFAPTPLVRCTILKLQPVIQKPVTQKLFDDRALWEYPALDCGPDNGAQFAHWTGSSET
jgi:hypothetical protein